MESRHGDYGLIPVLIPAKNIRGLGYFLPMMRTIKLVL